MKKESIAGGSSKMMVFEEAGQFTSPSAFNHAKAILPGSTGKTFDLTIESLFRVVGGGLLGVDPFEFKEQEKYERRKLPR